MTTYEFIDCILNIKKEKNKTKIENETQANEVATLISGQFIIPLFFKLQENDYDMITIKQHLESLYDNENHFGLVYFIFILANAADVIVPHIFNEMCANDVFVPILSGAIIDDWLDLDFTNDNSDDE